MYPSRRIVCTQIIMLLCLSMGPWACAGLSPAAKAQLFTQSFAKQDYIGAPGFSTGIDAPYLARNVAKGRALANLAAQMNLEGFHFELERGLIAKSDVRLKKLMAIPTKIRYPIVKDLWVDGHWMAMAYAERPKNVSESMKVMSTKEGVGQDSQQNIAKASRQAKKKALLNLITQFVPDKPGVYQGTITLVDLVYDYQDSGVQVRLQGKVNAKRVVNLTHGRMRKPKRPMARRAMRPKFSDNFERKLAAKKHQRKPQRNFPVRQGR